jgi:hypothetical protein
VESHVRQGAETNAQVKPMSRQIEWVIADGHCQMGGGAGHRQDAQGA